MNYKNRITASVLSALVLAGCGAESTINVKQDPLPPIVGQFVDAPVAGLSYSISRDASGVSDAITGTTDANGNFEYFRGDSITFSIGEITFPSTAGANFVTPLQVFGTDTVFNQRVVNTLRLLQTLDADGNPENGISISSEAASAAVMPIDTESFFTQSDEEFAAQIEAWLPNAGTSNTSVVSRDAAIEHFVNYVDDELNLKQPNAFDPTKFSGVITRAYVKAGEVTTETYVFTPEDSDTGLNGQFSQLDGETEIATGSYAFSFGNRHLVLTQQVDGSDDIVTQFTGRSFNTETGIYGLCLSDASSSLAENAKECDDNETAANNSFVFADAQLEAELSRLAELPAEETRELVEEFATDANTFQTSGYKKVGDNPLYAKTGGSLVIENNALVLTGDRFSIGNNTPSVTTSGSDTVQSTSDAGHRFNLSQGFTISFDVVEHGGGDAGAGSLSIYADNNTTSESNSVHGRSSKFLSIPISNADFVAGETFSYTYDPVAAAAALVLDPEARVLSPFVKNSFIQIRTDSAGIITIDNLVIDTVAGFGIPNDTDNAPEPEPEPEPEPQAPVIPRIDLPASADYVGVTEDIFSTAYGTIKDASGADIPLYTKTGGSVAIVADGLELDSGRFTIGHSTPDVDTTADDTSATGVLDLSRPYYVIMDIVSVSDADGDNNFQIYVDNSTSSSSKSIHGGASKFYSELINTHVAGTTLKVEGLVATNNSFIQLRTESGGTVVINNLRIEYLDENLLLEETFNEATAETFFTAEYKALATDSSAPFFNITGGGSNMVFADNQLTLNGSRFTLGETNPGTDTAEGVAPEGSLDLSKPYKIFVDIIAISEDSDMSKDFLIYLDNNTSSSSKSHLGGDSKFYHPDLADLVVGQTIEVEGPIATANSFLQFRTESNANVTIDNIRIEYINNNIVVDEVFDGATAEQFFTADYKALPSDESAPLYNVTGGGSAMVFADDQLTLSGSRFTIGETNPGTDTADGVAPEGALDLSIPYKVLVDIVAISEDSNMTKDFLIYVDNNTSSSSKSHLGGSSKFFASDLADLVVGQTLEVEGLLATKNSFLQVRTEGSATVTIDNLRIEYLEQDNTVCGQATDLYFCDDFTAGNLDNWQIWASTSASSAEGEFDILTLEDGNNVMRYTAGGAGGEIIVATDAAMANVPDSGNFYVEAEIRPRQNSTTANKQLYLMARYLSEGNWFGGGLNMQNASSSTRVELAISTEGSISRPVQAKTPLLLGEKGGTEDGVWYTVRFELIDDALTVYLNGENMGSVSDTSYTAKGLIGIFTNNRSFELDNVKVGDPSTKPIQLTLDYKEPSWDPTTTTDALVINIAAFQNDGETADTFSVTSSNQNIVDVTIEGTMVTLMPVGEGDATITFVSGSDANIIRTIEVSVASGFNQPTMDYGSIAGLVTPDVSSTDGYIDTNLTITFDSEVSLDSGGEVHIYKSSDDSLVDLLRVGYNLDVLSALDKTRELKYTPLSIAQDGKTLVIDPRNDVLEYGETYYVVIGDKVVSGAKLNGIDFIGLGKVSDWSFTTKFVGPSTNHILVNDDGEADFRTVQGALTHIMNNVGKDAQATVSIKDGIYNELLFLRNQNNITLQGESRENTIVQYENYESLNGGSSGRPLFLVESADMLVLNNFTIKNTHVRNNTDSNQAETIYFNSSHRLIANNMNFISEQDTLLIKGYAWFYNTLVAGNVDFIWGYPVAALFEDSEIRTIGDSKNGPTDVPVDGGYVLQSRTPVLTDPGFVFLNSEFTHGAGPLGNTVAENSTYIARGAGKTDSFDNVTLINNKFDTHIITSGWYPTPTPNPAVSDALSGFREYGSMDMSGSLLDVSNREGGYQLIESEVTDLTSRVGIFASFNSGAGWSPEPLAIPSLPDAPAEAADVVVETGFAGYNFDITGGAGGSTVTVNNGLDLISALADAKSANSPVTIYVNGTITDANSGNTGNSIDIKDMNDVSIIGVGNQGELDGIGIQIRRANNIIIQNLTIHEVLTGGKDAISIEGDDDGSTTSNIWIDHNELYSSLEVEKDYYDGLLDSKSGAENITISYNYLHDSWKTSLHGHSDDDSNENKNRNITFHHNRFENLESRVPLFRFGFGHLYNNYFNNINSTAINSRMGAELLIENNYFENTKNPIVSFYSDNLGYWNQSGNFFGVGVTWSTPASGDATGQDGSSTSTFQVPYDYTLDPADEVKDKVLANAGVGKLDQSDLDIPEVEVSEPLDDPIQSDVTLPYSENFSASNSDEFFSNNYRDLSGSAGDGTPMYHRVTGTVSIENGELTMTGARVSIGNTTGSVSTTDADTNTTGVFDLSGAYQVSFKVVSVAGNTDKNFQIYVDNNTSGSSNSIHGGSSKFHSIALSELVPGQTYVVDGLSASQTSFITIRSESDATITLDDLTIQ
ncbi:pectinesterase family protein [Paraglaciecola aquimarina]|uniref:Pectinesterase family protein n=1 Tax=Paraglaciecola algarum TaxID=3050085 RepID=A0ABS9DD89_9ALTE|nr:pectinesterase family protein [Paraglaciecola sp. G1-23]MCF2949601.1 pectinesterase family protein [Paraglaciecola sp. G1-23]